MQLFDFDTTLWQILIRKTCTELYQNRPRFVKDMTKTFWCVFQFTFVAAVHLQHVNAKFHKAG